MKHGTRSKYKSGCKCEPCRQANREYVNLTNREGWSPNLVDSSRSRDHVRALQWMGMGRREIARRSGVSETVIARLLGLDTSKPAKRVRPATQMALLSVKPYVLAPGANVPILGSQRRLQALVSIGWSQTELARRLGWTVQNLSAITNGRREHVQQKTASAIRTLFDELEMTFGPSRRAVSHADRHGWFPPLAWEDIDDPLEVPKMRKKEGKFKNSVTLLEDFEDTRHEHGGDLERAAARLGTTRYALEKALSRAREAA